MTLDRWLQAATGTFPRGVRERLAQEYGAHLEDSVAAGGSGDAVELFGEPQQLKRSLKKLYVSQKRLEQIKKYTRIEWVFWALAFFLTLDNLISVLDFFGTRFFVHFLIKFILVLLPFLLIWIYTFRFEKTRRASFWTSTSSIALSVSTIYGLIFDSPYESHPIGSLFLGLIMIPSLIYFVMEDKALERTMRIEKISLNRRRVDLHPDR